MSSPAPPSCVAAGKKWQSVSSSAEDSEHDPDVDAFPVVWPGFTSWSMPAGEAKDSVAKSSVKRGHVADSDCCFGNYFY